MAAAAVDPPLSAGEFALLLDRLGPFERPPQVAVAVSGGPDSMALALLAAGWATGRGGGILALTVDHGLRPEAAAEAREVVAWLAARDIRCRVLSWAGAKPVTGIQAAAREARYRLLGEACRQAGILHLLVAHQLEDQAETVAMRAARGSGVAGRAGMPAVREVTGLRILRPLLGVRRCRLAAVLAAAGQPWLRDPANDAPRFARARLRQDPTFDAPEVARRALRCARRRTEDEQRLAAALARAVRPHPLGFVRARLPDLEWQLEQALERLLVTVSGHPLPPRRERLARLVERVREERGGRVAATLAGCLVRVSGRILTVLREPAAAIDSVTLRPGERRRWDERFEVTYRAGSGALQLRRLDAAGRARLGPRLTRELRRQGVPAAALESLPALWDGERLVACPPLAGAADEPTRHDGAACATWVPTRGVAEAPFLGANIVSVPDPLIYADQAGAAVDRLWLGVPAAPLPARDSSEADT